MGRDDWGPICLNKSADPKKRAEREKEAEKRRLRMHRLELIRERALSQSEDTHERSSE